MSDSAEGDPLRLIIIIIIIIMMMIMMMKMMMMMMMMKKKKKKKKKKKDKIFITKPQLKSYLQSTRCYKKKQSYI